ncbi:aluminum-activated malate transporter 2-like [Papaver somniferum]|uniref:aluminum-activated malate transporter 2-like n=1 Tax=Papaver somniferum TaxID=3469 RepID=UPI000E6FD23C|nr:aluminum-activated malate transporter 2-like [Papaver somniferum]
MDIDETAVSKSGGFLRRRWWWLKALTERLIDSIVEFAHKVEKLGKDDPRRIVHSIKVGLTLSLVSLLYYIRPIYGGFGSSTMWAIITVVVVFEYSVGATLGKGFNRALATFFAGALGFGVHHLATLAGDKGEPAVRWFFVFLLAAVASFARFFPGVKARYDYGVLIFILTFCLVSVSGYQEAEILKLAHQRVLTILLGCLTCVIMSIFLFPVWAGADFHKLIARNIEKQADFLKGFGELYFGTKEETDMSWLHGYRSVLNSKTAEEAMANFARWEPPHGKFRFRHPWKQYLKVGAMTRQCAYRLEAISNGITSEIKEPSEFKKIITLSCMEICLESGKALQEISTAVKKMTYPFIVSTHIMSARNAADDLHTALETITLENTNILEDVMPAASVISLLLETIECTENIAESVKELACLAKFKGADVAMSPEKQTRRLLRRGNIKPHHVENDSVHALITVYATSAMVE